MLDPSVHPQARMPTGLLNLDRATGGGSPGDLWVVRGSAGAGKTIFALGLARAAALRTQAPLRWIARDEEPETLAALVMSAEARLTVERLGADDLSDAEQVRLAAAKATSPRHR